MFAVSVGRVTGMPNIAAAFLYQSTTWQAVVDWNLRSAERDAVARRRNSSDIERSYTILP